VNSRAARAGVEEVKTIRGGLSKSTGPFLELEVKLVDLRQTGIPKCIKVVGLRVAASISLEVGERHIQHWHSAGILLGK